MYSSVRQATADLTSAVLGADAGSVVAEGLDTNLRWTLPCMQVLTTAPIPSPQVAEGLDTIVAAQARRSRLEPKMDPASHASAHHGALSPRCGAQATLSSVTCTGVGWLLQASSDDL
jgi:hypothetical protein